MAGMRDYSDEEINLVRKSFSGRYALRDRCYFEMALQTGLRVSEMLSLTVGQVYQYGKVVDEVSIDRKHMKGARPGKPRTGRFPWCVRHPPPCPGPPGTAWPFMLKLKDRRAIDPSPRSFSLGLTIKTAVPAPSPGKPRGVSSRPSPARMSCLAR